MKDMGGVQVDCKGEVTREKRKVRKIPRFFYSSNLDRGSIHCDGNQAGEVAAG